MIKTPIIILTKERPIQFSEMIKSIETTTDIDTYELIIVDNKSTHPDMVDYLNLLKTKYKVIFNDVNKGLAGFNDGLALVNTKFFIYSDPDIVLNSDIPSNWILRFIYALENIATPKIGFALNIKYDIENEFTKRVQSWETPYWSDNIKLNLLPYGIDADAYYAPIDTTLAMYRNDTFTFWDKGLSFKEGHGLQKQNNSMHIPQEYYNPLYSLKPIRVAGNYTAVHTGWDVRGIYKEEMDFYSKNCELGLASTTRWRLSNEAGK